MNSPSSAASSRSCSSVFIFADEEPGADLVVPAPVFLFRAFRGFLLDGVDDFAMRGVESISRKRWKFASSDVSIVASALRSLFEPVNREMGERL